MSENTMMHAVQRHMYYQNKPQDLRLSILETQLSQSLRIKVMPLCGKNKDVCKTGPSSVMITNQSMHSNPFAERRHGARLDRCDDTHDQLLLKLKHFSDRTSIRHRRNLDGSRA